MKRIALFSVIISLVISCAAPLGAAFALEESVIPELITEEKGIEMLPEYAMDGALVSNIPSSDLTEQLAPKVATTEAVEAFTSVLSAQVAPAIVIAQIQVGISGNSSDEYVSIYNNGDEVVDVTGWCLRNKANKNFACVGGDIDYSIEPGAYIGFSSLVDRPGSYGLTVPLMAGSNHIVASSDTIQLVDGDLVVDTITWVAQPSSHYAIERTWDIEQAGRLQTGNESWSWKAALLEYGHILELVECGGGVFVVEGEECPVINSCEGLVISEIAANHDEQFIELHNPSNEPILIEGCKVQTNRSSASFVFPEGAGLGAGEYSMLPIAESGLTLTKTTTGTVYVLSSDGVVEAENVPYANLAEGTSWALVDDTWVQTYEVTPGTANIYQEYLPCDEGYVRSQETGRCNKIPEPETLADCGEGRERNPTTGRCRNIIVASVLKPCAEGQYRSEETNRCRSILTSVASILKPCADGQFRNPETNRCKKIASSEDLALADCGEGRERNPETNRCRNVLGVSTVAEVAPFPVEETPEDAEKFAGWWVLGGIAAIGLGYGLWEWRDELIGFGRKAGRFVTGKK